MSPRLKRLRKVLNPPIVKGFKPYGPELHPGEQTPVNLLYEEYEALRLCDYDMFNHHQASLVMGVSRPTYTRIYASAREKIARAFVEGRQIAIEGGKVYFDSDWYHCNHCQCYFNNPERTVQVERCPLCGSSQVKGIGRETAAEDLVHYEDVCICPQCGFQLEHTLGMPCSQEICPECGTRMRRRGRNE